ncbi:MAG: ribonuclease H [Caulobacteraceae bacterium]
MTAPLVIWLEISHHAAFRMGGWAYVRSDGIEVTGQAGGDRRVEAERAALQGLIAALKAQPARLHTASALVEAIPARIAAAQAGDNPPTENLDLWAQAMKALAASPVQMLRAVPAPDSPTAFAAAWADLARDKARDKGPFTSAIPKPNLAKLKLRGP